MKVWGTLLVALALFGVGLYVTYDGLVSKEEAVFRAWADVESTLQRRADLIPNLVATVRGSAAHEQKTLKLVVEARAQAMQPLAPRELSDPALMQRFQQSQSALGSALSRLLVVAESYPELKASRNFQDLQVQLEGTENRINVARERYNQAVGAFNGAIRSFLGARINERFLHLEPKEYFKAGETAKAVPSVSF